jgi:DNA-binding XRE family transcriptional regulator
VLDLTKPGERRVEALLRWAATGEKPLWLPLAIRRHDDKLLVAVEWRAWPHLHSRPLGLVELSLTGNELRWQSFGRRQRERLLARLVSGETMDHSALRFGEILQARREAAGLTQLQVASAARLSSVTIANLESGRNMPTAQTVTALRSVSALRLADVLPQYAPLQSVAQP